ncbi:class I SAM-dependent methyltransferase [Actinoplanes subtropicus]|uniref:class I SAM-dependent methyltransferase n=1 Tax=Actinoplanes subtropicus TaxID=543632 RepID=UPI00054F080C|nr:class I SAM-dependent methyltransferase [Actinoplanes subtropicus]
MADVAALRARNAEYWQHSAPGWIRHAERQDALGRPLGAAAIDRLAPRPGERIVDVGCGCGGTTAELAAAVAPGEIGAGPRDGGSSGGGSLGGGSLGGGSLGGGWSVGRASGGEVVGVDISEAMVAAAARRFPGVRFVAADVEAVGLLPGAPFDAAFSRMAVMLFADPVAGCSAIRRSLRPGGRFAATVFRDAAANPWLAAALLGAAPHLGPVAPLPLGDEPGPFAFADAARIRRVLTEAGFDPVTVEAHDVTVEAPDDPDTVAEWLVEVGPAGPAYRAAAQPARSAARAGAARLLDRFRRPGDGYRLPTGIWVIAAAVEQ